MSTKIILFLAAIVLILVLLIGSMRGGPRVTQITRTVRKDKDEPEDGADA